MRVEAWELDRDGCSSLERVDENSESDEGYICVCGRVSRLQGMEILGEYGLL
jgi:hypothetical protein